MKRTVLPGVLLLAACAGGPPAPDWQANAHAALAAHAAAYLAGRDRVAALELARARAEAARTGDAGQMARVELTACAARIAALDYADCPAARPLLQDADAEARVYADYLAGEWGGLDREKLPPPQRGVPVAADAPALLAGIEEPFSRLVAAAQLLRAGRLSPAGIEMAIATASRQGWRRPLLAWLGFERERCQAAGDTACAAARQRQMDRVTGTAGGDR